MHTATRLALPVIDRVRALQSRGPCLRLWALRAAERRHPARARRADRARVRVRRGSARRWPTGCRVRRRVSSRARRGPTDDLPRLSVHRRPIARISRRSRATRAAGSAPTRKIVGYTEGTRGCKHRCRHCPIVPVYDGRFRVVPSDVVLADIARAGGRRRAAHHVRRSRLLQRAHATRWRSSRGWRASIPASPTT